MNFQDTEIIRLGSCEIDTPLDIPKFIDEKERVILTVEYGIIEEGFKTKGMSPSFINAGPRKKIFFNPNNTTAAILTCGGLSPGINNVVKSIVSQLYYEYNIKNILGLRYGYEGLVASYGHKPVKLVPQDIDDIHEKGGSVLASSRGMQKVPDMVDFLEKNKIDILFAIGGDGTLAGANAIFEEVTRRRLKIAVVGIPKTIDNDIMYVDRTFGFTTAVSHATEAIKAAHAEAKGARNGIGLVKVMGRDSGFIASYAALASNDVNYVFIPEVPFAINGEKGFLSHLHKRLQMRSHAVVLVAEGAGQEYFSDMKQHDASGNVKYGDFGMFMRDTIIDYFKKKDFHINLKYIDPSYIIRSMPASADDAVFCIMLAQNAVHGAMAGMTGMFVGRVNKFFTFIPLKLVIGRRKKIDPNGYLWSIVKAATGQLDFV